MSFSYNSTSPPWSIVSSLISLIFAWFHELLLWVLSLNTVTMCCTVHGRNKKVPVLAGHKKAFAVCWGLSIWVLAPLQDPWLCRNTEKEKGQIIMICGSNRANKFSVTSINWRAEFRPNMIIFRIFLNDRISPGCLKGVHNKFVTYYIIIIAQWSIVIGQSFFI